MIPQIILRCPECGANMYLKEGRFGPFFSCCRWPSCTGAHAAHANGTPMGIPADKETRRLRNLVHLHFDLLWQEGGMTRQEAYTWLQQIMNLTPEEAHIGRFTRDQCEQLIQRVLDYQLEKICAEI
jgi:ssDNA-binding Zn-finger/Zn-ribbon topoisomerase 1